MTPKQIMQWRSMTVATWAVGWESRQARHINGERCIIARL
jgi:hypothetical protein